MGRRRTYGLSFSLSRATGLAAAKAKLSREIGIPLTRSGRRQKLGRLVGKAAGCALIPVTLLAALVATCL